jgi:hypothetical protein
MYTGARYFVCSPMSKVRKEILDYMERNYRLVQKGEDFRIYEL